MKYIFIAFALLISSCIVNAQPRLVSLLAQQYANSTWHDSAEEEYSYDANGRISEIISGGPNIATGVYSKAVFSYNSAGAIQHMDDYSWDDNTSNWGTTPSSMADHYYNSSGKLEKIVFNSAISGTSLDSFVYDGSGLLTESHFKSSHETAKNINTYNSSGQIIETINSYFSNNNWINRGKDENKYNNAGQISERKGYYWNANTSSWVYLNTITYTYNNGALTEKLDESPSFSSTRTIYTYNTDGTLAEELYQYLDGATWINSDRTLYFYDNTSAINKIEAKDIDVYPNPSTGMFTVDFNFDETPAQVLVMDIAGKQVFKQHINSGYTVEVNLQNLDKGIYLLQIAAAGKVDVKKIIVQ